MGEKLTEDPQPDVGGVMLVDRALRGSSQDSQDSWDDAGLALLLRNPPRPAVLIRPRRRPRDPALRLPLAVLIGLVAAFLSWSSADPFWLAAGVGTEGTATVTRCASWPVADRCSGSFIAADGSFRVRVGLTGLDPSQRRPGARVGARLLRADSDLAYAGSLAGLRLRWLLGLALVLGCGAAVGVVTGVPRLRQEGARRLATLWALSFGGPLLLWATSLLLAMA